MNLSLFGDDPLPPMLMVEPIIDYSVRGLCVKPYKGRKKGCPNFGDPKHSHRCPPGAPHFDRYFDISLPVYAIVNEFDLEAHFNRMKSTPKRDGSTRSDDEAKCVLYWQGGARAALKAKISAALAVLSGYEATWCPEGMGVDVTATLLNAGIRLEWPVAEIKVARQVAFLAKPLKFNV